MPASAERPVQPSPIRVSRTGDVHVYPTYGPIHDTESSACWCEPCVVHVDADDDSAVWLHRELH
jgi:hypothetical protein